MKVKFIKHHSRYKIGEEADLDDALAGYLIRVGMATIESESPEATEEKLSKKLKSTKKKK